jgi:hypothetical protein
MRLPCLLAIVLQCTVITITAQTNNRLSGSDYILAVNNIKVSLDPSGAIGYSNYNPFYFHVPANGNVPAMYGGFFWVGGKDELGVARTLTPDWYDDKTESRFGPFNYDYYDLTEIEYDLLYAPYNRVWLVSKADILYHQLHFNDDDYIMPEAILNWPGNGDIDNGFSAQLAPFIDVNNNLIYEPNLGDYPLIKGDAAIFAMYHDNILYETDAEVNLNTNIEVHVLMYAFEAAPTDYLGNTLFVDYTIFNRGDFDFDSLYGGSFVDFAIGANDDDYCGSDSTLNLFYGYNGDLADGPSEPHYNTLPALGCLPLSHPLNSFMFLNSDFSPLGYPDNSEQFLYALDGKFGDGVQMTTGGNGYNTSATDYTNYMYHGNVNDTTQWTEITESNTPYWRRGVGSIYLDKLSPGNSRCATFAYVFADAGSTISNTESVDLLKTYSSQTASFYQTTDTIGCLETTYIPLSNNNLLSSEVFNVYPNPAETTLYLTTGFQANTNFSFSIYSMTGSLIFQQSITNNTDAQTHSININQQATGAYLLVINYDGYHKTFPVLFK